MTTLFMFLDPPAFLLVLGGTLAATFLRSTRRDLLQAVRALAPLVRSDPEREELASRRALAELERVVDLKGYACADQAKVACAYVRRGALRLADAPGADAFARWADRELDDRAARHQAVAAVWRAAAEAAPAMGMIGTVIGLVLMFAAMDDPRSIGPAMAMAMLTTLYGLVLSAAIAGPIAGRLERLSTEELRWQRAASARLRELASEKPKTTEAWLRRRREAA